MQPAYYASEPSSVSVPVPEEEWFQSSVVFPEPSRLCISSRALDLDQFPRSIRRALFSCLVSLSVNACLSRIVLPDLTEQRFVAAPNDCRQIEFHPRTAKKPLPPSAWRARSTPKAHAARLERFNHFAVVKHLQEAGMRILPHRIVRPAVIAWLLFTVQAYAQTGQQDDLPGQGALPTTEDSQDPQEVGVDVSLGRQEVKQKIAAKLGICETEVPLAVHVPIALAERVCEKEAFDARANANRSCTATKYIPEIAEAARNHAQTSAVPEQ